MKLRALTAALALLIAPLAACQNPTPKVAGCWTKIARDGSTIVVCR